MAIPKNLPTDPYAVLDPDCRWYPGEEQLAGVSIGHLIPPLVDKIRRGVKEWRESGYAGASATSRALLRWWFETPHPTADGGEFRYYFAQREAVETIVWLYEVKQCDKFGLARFDSSGLFAPNGLPENWRRFVVKMATGSGKTKTISLVVAWSFFHKRYEDGSPLSRNILLIAPNIIVLDRLARDFAGLRIFREDPILPVDGFEGRNWRDDFQMRVHRQDEVRGARAEGNIFLTNIHRIYSHNDAEPSPDDDDSRDYFLGPRPTGQTNDPRIDLGEIVREIDELLVINDEAHHIHDENLAWFKSIEDIHNRLAQKGAALSLQADFTATPKHNNGAIFAQTVCDYPLVEAIHQNIVKRPVAPDDESAATLKEKTTIKYVDRYRDYIHLGVVEWRKAREELSRAGKKAILFVMTDDTKNCDALAAHLENEYHDLQGKTLVIHTKQNGEISEAASARDKHELAQLRKMANEIDDFDNPYRAVVSVLMLREGWDVRNVTTIVGLRAYTTESKILPEQTLGRGLRRMFVDETVEEKVSVIGTAAFYNFVKEIEKEGVVMERVAMGERAPANAPFIVRIDRENKNVDALDIEIPLLAPRFAADYSRLRLLDPAAFERAADKTDYPPIEYLSFAQEESAREIVFRDVISGKISHTTRLTGNAVDDYSHVIGYFAQAVMRQARLFSGYDLIYEKTMIFIRDFLFGRAIDLADRGALRNLAEPRAAKTILETFRREMNRLLVRDLGPPQTREGLRVSKMHSFAAKPQEYYSPAKSPQDKILGNALEIDFAKFLDDCADVVAFAKNYDAVGFKVEYADKTGGLRHYLPDFLARTTAGKIFVIETKGRIDDSVAHKSQRLAQWRDDVNAAAGKDSVGCLFVEEEPFRRHRPQSFAALVDAFPDTAADI